MNLAKVSANGQITVPVEIRRYLKLYPLTKSFSEDYAAFLWIAESTHWAATDTSSNS
jgi:hypothetical protein